MVQRLRPAAGRLDENGQILLGLLLADVFPQGVGAQGQLAAVLRQEALGNKGLLVNIRSEVDAHGPASLPYHFLQRLTDDLLQGQGVHVDALQGQADLLGPVAQHRQSRRRLVALVAGQGYG